MVEYLAGGRIQGSSSVGAVDTLGTAVNGTNSGTVTDNNTPFYGETSVAFDNNDAVHDLGTTSSFAGLVKEDFTVIFWAKAAAVGNGGAGSNNGWGAGSSSNTYAGNQGTILNCGQVSGNGSNQGFVISFDDEGSQEFYMWMGDGNGNVILNDVIGSNDVADTDNNWHLYMFHFDNTNSQVKIYRDGGSSAIQTTSYASQVSSTSATTYKKMFMGRQADDDGRYFIGSLADVSIWKRLVTTSEFNTLWGTFQDNTSTATNSVKGVRVDALSDESGLLAHWKLNDLNFTNSASASDEKQTLADATSDSTQVAGTSDITDLTWTQTVGSSTSDTFYVLKDTSNDLMDVKAAGNCGTDGSPSIAYATLSEALGTIYWRMRFKLVFNTVTAESTGGKSFFTNFFIVDSGTSSSGVGSENGFGFKFIADAGSTQTQYYVTTSGTDSGTTMNWTPSSGSTIYVEISWEGGTATANFYSDSGYSNRVSSTTANATRSGTFSGLKFPQIALRQDTGGNGVMEIDMSNLEIINRVSTAPNANTRYEETDTRKIYRFSPSTLVDSSASSLTDVVFDASTEIGDLTYSGNEITRSSDSYARHGINSNFFFRNSGTQTVECVAQNTGTSSWVTLGLSASKLVDVGVNSNAPNQLEYAIRAADDGRTWIRQSSNNWTQVSDTADNTTFKITNNRTTVTYYANGSSIGTTTHGTPASTYYIGAFVSQTGTDGSFVFDYSGDITSGNAAEWKERGTA